MRTNYGGAWVGGIVPALLGQGDATWLPAAARDARAVVLLVLDGLGWSALRDHPGRLPELTRMDGVPITTVAPSTTSAALTSIVTGLAPAQHGVVGYRMRFRGQVLNILRWHHAGSDPPDPVIVQPTAPFLGHAVPVVTRSEFRDTGFTGVHLRGTRLLGWRTPSALVEHCRLAVGAGEAFVYAYYDGVDKVAHEYGLHGGFYGRELADADRLVGDLLDVLPADCSLLVTADHGQVHVGTDHVARLEILDRYVALYSGEGRFRSLHARSAAARDLLRAASDEFSEVAWVFSREQLFDEGWLGDGGGAEVRGRIGDVVLAPFASTAFRDPTDPREAELVGRHGSLTADEMLVPLAAARGRA